MTDWLSEVLIDLYLGEHFANSVSSKEFLKQMDNKLIAKAHKLISAQLIREQRAELEKLGNAILTDGSSYDDIKPYVQKRLADLTNQLKELEDE